MKYKTSFKPDINEPGLFEQEFQTLEEAEAALSALYNYHSMLNELSLIDETLSWGMNFVFNGEDWVDIDG